MATSMMKQRLIGAAVLIALGVIFIPMLLTGDGKFLSDGMDSKVPEKPMYELEAPKVLPLDKRAQQTGGPVSEPATVKTQENKTEKKETVADAGQSSNVNPPAVAESAPEESNSPEEKSAAKPAAKQSVTQSDTGKTETEKVTETKTESKAPEPVATAEKKPVVKVPEKKPVVSGFVVQLGSFSVQKNAINLRDRLRKNGHASFVEEYKRNGKTSYRVRVGPELTRDLANELKKKLKAETKIDGFVVEFPAR